MHDRGKGSVRADTERPQIPPVRSQVAIIFAKGFKIKTAGERFFLEPVCVLDLRGRLTDTFLTRDWVSAAHVCQSTNKTIMKHLRVASFPLHLCALCSPFLLSLRCTALTSYVWLSADGVNRSPADTFCFLSAVEFGCDIIPGNVKLIWDKALHGWLSSFISTNLCIYSKHSSLVWQDFTSCGIQ